MNKQKKQNRIRSRALAGAFLAAGLAAMSAQAQQIKWGLTLVNINNPITPILTTNANGSLSITAGGGDTYSAPDSFTYAYQQITGDFDIAVQVMDVTATDAQGQDSPKGALMVRASLDPSSYNYQISAMPLAPSGRDGEIESIGRLDKNIDTDDVPGRMQKYGGDTTTSGYCTYPDVWLRIQRQGSRMSTYFKSTNTTDYPVDWSSNPGSTNGWQLLTVTKTGTNFPKTVYVGLSTVAHNGNIADTDHTVTAIYANYGPVGSPPSNPSVEGGPAIPGTEPGPFPNKKVLAANFDASLPADGLGYPGDIVQSGQGAPAQIVWNSGGFGSVSRDIIANISGQTPGGFALGRYQAGAFDFLISPRDPVAAVKNLGPYSNPLRERYSSGATNVAASQAWAPSPNYGFAYATVRKNGQQWNDTAPGFFGAAYVQLDGVASAKGYDMISGHFRGAQFYTRTTKLVTGSPTDPASSLGNLQRCALPISIGWFPYDQGWKAGYFDGPDQANLGAAHWKRGDGWGLNSGAAVEGLPLFGGQKNYNGAGGILTWVDTSGGSLFFSGLATLSLPGVNSINDGMLFTIGNDENNSTRGPSASNAALTDGTGWYVAVRDIETSKVDPTVYASGGGNDCGASFSFLYMPYNADNLVGGHIAANGSKVKGAGNYTVTRISTGRYAISIPGKTGADGALLLQNTGYLATQPAGMTDVVDNSYLSYEFGGTNTPANSFIVEARYVDATAGGEGEVKLRDAGFNFVFIDFLNPVAPPGTTPPVLSLSRTGNSAVVSWTNGAGFILQRSPTISPAS
ncbi:MAG: hypothetical protein NTX27_06325, partial [Verrucomicrobia bacterium]|nr:hypothetical protein [Verrucomicrobiota bacterium]